MSMSIDILCCLFEKKKVLKKVMYNNIKSRNLNWTQIVQVIGCRRGRAQLISVLAIVTGSSSLMMLAYSMTLIKVFSLG